VPKATDRGHGASADRAVREYIDAIAPAHRPLFDRLHRLILEVHPGATVVLSYQIPSYKAGRRRLYLGAWKHGVSIYGWQQGGDAGFTARHPELRAGKGTIKLRPEDAAAIGDDELPDQAPASSGGRPGLAWHVRPVLAGAPFIGFIPVRGIFEARGFYERVLGLRVVEDTPFAVVLDANGTMLRLIPVPALAVQSFTIAGWQVPGIAAAVRDLQARGVRFTRYDGMGQDDLGVWTAPGGDQVAWFTDPDGNTLSLTEFAAPGS
jgi:catechol 2,3-dioxygenase-like lactoylglutathione lyase family enzyme